VSEFGGRFIAAPKRFPFGTAFRIPGYANGDPVPVLDRGGAIKGNKIDCYFESHQAALNFGRQTLVVMYSD
jgi:3D (Asp-Asp-Asp) domain-containing protein